MSPVILPRPLYCPFHSVLNPYAAEIEPEMAEFLLDFGLVDSQDHLDSYRRQGFSCMVGRMFPTADREALRVLADLNALLFVVDDQFDCESAGTSLDEVKSFLPALIHAIHFLDQESSNKYLRALQDVWRRLVKISSPKWRSGIVDELRRVFEAAIWQKQCSANDVLPKLTDYMAYRRYLGAANIATNSIELVLDVSLEDDVDGASLIKKLAIPVENSVCWANDIFSLNKEIEQGNEFNIVRILEREKKIDQELAISRAIEMHDQFVINFIKIESGHFSDISRIGNDNLTRYVESLKYVMRGNIEWSRLESDRYDFLYPME